MSETRFYNEGIKYRERIIINSMKLSGLAPTNEELPRTKRVHMPGYFVTFIRSPIAILRNLIWDYVDG
jgi:hypothetical protein